MRIAPGTEDDVLAKAVLFTKYVRCLPGWLESRTWSSQGLALLTDLLGGIRDITRVDCQAHQNLFRCAALVGGNPCIKCWYLKPCLVSGAVGKAACIPAWMHACVSRYKESA